MGTFVADDGGSGAEVEPLSLSRFPRSCTLAAPLDSSELHTMAAPRRICVVGGGIIGSSTAFFLARLAQARALPVEITLVEGSSVAAGASGKAGGLLALDWHGCVSLPFLATPLPCR